MNRRILTSLVVALLGFSGAPGLRANDMIPAPPQSHPILFRNATIHPVSGPDLARSDLLIDKGRIVRIGAGLETPAGAEVIDVTGKHIYPGLIAADSSIGLQEIGAVRATTDLAEPGDLNPNARAETSVNPDSELIPVTRSNGILVALSVPQTSGGLIAGTSALIELDGWTWEQMTVLAPVGLHIFWPGCVIENDPRYPKTPEDQRKDLREKLHILDEAFASARAYAAAKLAARPDFKTDVRWESMIPVIEGKVPIIVHANEIKQIESAVDFATREKLTMILSGGADAWRVTDLLKKNHIPVIVSSTFEIPLRRQDGFDMAFSNPAKLAAAGVAFCIAASGSDAEAPHLRNLPYQAGMAAAHGLAREEALKSITLYPAQILGVGDRLGSLESGKDATLIITSGDPIEATTNVEVAYIEGRKIDLTNRQTRLHEKYMEKYRQLQGGK